MPQDLALSIPRPSSPPLPALGQCFPSPAAASSSGCLPTLLSSVPQHRRELRVSGRCLGQHGKAFLLWRPGPSPRQQAWPQEGCVHERAPRGRAALSLVESGWEQRPSSLVAVCSSSLRARLNSSSTATPGRGCPQASPRARCLLLGIAGPPLNPQCHQSWFLAHPMGGWVRQGTCFPWIGEPFSDHPTPCVQAVEKPPAFPPSVTGCPRTPTPQFQPPTASAGTPD